MSEDQRRAARDAWLTALAERIVRDGSPMDDMGWEITHE